MINLNNIQKNNHSKVLSYEKRELQVVTEQEKERSGGANKIKNSQINGVYKQGELKLKPKKISGDMYKLENRQKERKSFSVDKNNDGKGFHGLKGEYQVSGRGGSMRGVDLDKLKIFVDDKKKSD